MDIIVLDQKSEGESTCYLAKVTMSEYLEQLPDNYKDWNIQRGIVNNHYLDKLIETILLSKHIPPLVLITDGVHINNGVGSVGNVGSVESFQVLDGLQRTHRLKLIYNSVNFIKNYPQLVDESRSSSILKAVRRFSSEINSQKASSPIIRKLLSEVALGRNINDLFNFEQWIEVWENLSLTEQVNKMLLLNAGHKSVSKKHQIEIIFHNILSKLENEVQHNFSIVRERNVSSISVNKNRPVGQFSFAHIVSGMMSLDQGKPVTINANLLSKVQDDVDNYTLSYEEILQLCVFLAKLDSSLYEQYGDVGLKWLGKEVVITGLFGAIGIYSTTHSLSIIDSLELAREMLVEKPLSLALDSYDEVRNSLDVSKINIGKVNKTAVSNALIGVLEERTTAVNWLNSFKGDL